MYEVLFICSGNICRSPYAEGYLRHRLGADAAACSRSAGTLGIHTAAVSGFLSSGEKRSRGFCGAA